MRALTAGVAKASHVEMAVVKERLIEELHSMTTEGQSGVSPSEVASCFRTVAALDFQRVVEDMPPGIWAYYQGLLGRRPGVVIAIDQVVKAINAA